MNNKFKIIAVSLAAFMVGSFASNFAMSIPFPKFKVAVVDVPKVVAASSQVNNLKVDQRTKLQKIASFIDKAKSDVNAEKNPTAKKALEDKYNQELQNQKAQLDKDYATKLSAIDKNISLAISKKAKDLNCDLVVAKSVVLYSNGDVPDLTNDIIKEVK